MLRTPASIDMRVGSESSGSQSASRHSAMSDSTTRVTLPKAWSAHAGSSKCWKRKSPVRHNCVCHLTFQPGAELIDSAGQLCVRFHVLFQLLTGVDDRRMCFAAEQLADLGQRASGQLS